MKRSTKRATKKSSREIWAADSETDPFKAGRVPAPFIWGAYNGKNYFQCRTTDEFVEFFTERECVVYAHNGGKFDWHFLFGHLEAYQPLMVINGRIAKFKIGKAEFRDSFNLMPVPLSAYKKDDIDYSLFDAEVREQHMEAIGNYLRSDCVYLYELLTAFIGEFGMHLTQAGASIKAWEKISERKAPVTSRDFYREMEPFYFGGRVECFAKGEITRPFRIIDINSAYPFAMMHLHPWGETILHRSTLPETDDEISRCFIEIDAESRGALPLRADDKSLRFPSDGVTRCFFVTGWEFLAARDTDSLGEYKVHSVRYFEDTIEYQDYLNHFYQMKANAKREKDDARYLFAKLFMNSLYGKHGANPEEYEEYLIVPPRYIEASESDGYGYVAELGPHALVARPLAEEKQRYYNVAIAASITGFVRAYLWRAMHNASGVLYCDTDCLWCDDVGSLDLDPERLGAWDIEAECDYGAIAGKKLYAARTLKQGGDGERIWKTASKGVRLTREQIVRVAQGEIVTFLPENPTFSVSSGVHFVPRTVRMNARIEADSNHAN